MSVRTRMVLKRILFAALSLGAVALILFQAARLSRCDGLLVMQWQDNGDGGSDSVAAQLETNPLVMSSAVFRRSEAIVQTATNRRVNAVAYTTTASFVHAAKLPMASGRFFLPTDLAEENLIVLGNETAAELFAGRDCLGATVLLYGTEYTVIGVAAEKPVGIENFARVETAAVYLLDGGGAMGGTSFAYVRTVVAAADLLQHSLSSSANGMNQLIVHNISQSAGLAETVGNLLILLWLSVIGFHAAKAASERFQHPKTAPKVKSYKKRRRVFRILEVWRNAPVSDRRRILFWSIMAVSIGVAFLFVTVVLGFRLVIPGEWLTGDGGLTDYFISLNTNPAPPLFLAQLGGYALVEVVAAGTLALVALGKAVEGIHKPEDDSVQW